METPRGCAECMKTDKPLNNYSFHNLLGQEFVLFVCGDCIATFSKTLKAMTAGGQASYLTKLGQIITRN